jgi:hypothetical protein
MAFNIAIKQRVTLLLFSLVLVTSGFSQAKKPTLMVVPSDAFCIKNGYTYTYEQYGKTHEAPDYEKAIQSDPDLLLAIGKINTMMAKRGFPLKNLETELKKINQEKAENKLLMGSMGGMIQESPIDVLQRVAKADIFLQLTYTLSESGPNKSVAYNLQGIDTYTGKQIAGAQGVGEPSFSASVPALIEEAVIGNMDNFSNTLQDHFNDIFENGREVIVKIKIWDTSPVNLESEYDLNFQSEELSLILEDWISENTVEGRYSVRDVSATQMVFEQVRIPLFYERNGRERAMDTRIFVNNLRKYLHEDPFLLDAKVYQKGLGEAWLIIGEK